MAPEDFWRDAFAAGGAVRAGDGTDEIRTAAKIAITRAVRNFMVVCLEFRLMGPSFRSEARGPSSRDRLEFFCRAAEPSRPPPGLPGNLIDNQVEPMEAIAAGRFVEIGQPASDVFPIIIGILQ